MILPILFEDEDIIVINKPLGLLVHRTKMDFGETKSVVTHMKDQIGQQVYTVHRLDKPTSGVLIMAKNSEMAKIISLEFAERRVHKKYLALVRGQFPSEAIIDHPLKEELDKISDKMAKKDKPAQSALTHAKFLESIELHVSVDKYPTSIYSLVEASPVTGRKHQVRRHLRHLNHPIIGDINYGSSKHNRYFENEFQIRRLYLACIEMSFQHPRKKEQLKIQAPLDQDFVRVLKKLGFSYSYF